MPRAILLPVVVAVAVATVLGGSLVAIGVPWQVAAAGVPCGDPVSGAATRARSGVPGVVSGGVVDRRQRACTEDAEPTGEQAASAAAEPTPSSPPSSSPPSSSPPPSPAPPPAPAEPAPAEPAPAPPAPEPAPAPAPPAVVDPVWDRLAECESGGDWAIATGNGYYGGLQFAPGTWRAYGGAEFAPQAHRATREQQITVAMRVRDDRGGYGSWPACARKLGLPR